MCIRQLYQNRYNYHTNTLKKSLFLVFGRLRTRNETVGNKLTDGQDRSCPIICVPLDCGIYSLTTTNSTDQRPPWHGQHAFRRTRRSKTSFSQACHSTINTLNRVQLALLFLYDIGLILYTLILSCHLCKAVDILTHSTKYENIRRDVTLKY
jgi:hypothetical protein